MPTILVVDDEPSICEVLSLYLQRAGYTVQVANDGKTALQLLTDALPDLVVLDVMLPGIDGLEITRRLRHVGSTPVILLTARREEADRILGLELGADDYVVKPFSPQELVSRVRAVLRRTQGGESNAASGHAASGHAASGHAASGHAASGRLEHEAATLTFEGLTIDGRARLVYVNEQAVTLTAKEFDLLWFLARRPQQVFNRDQLLAEVWGETRYIDPSTVTVHVRRLREKLEADPAAPRFIQTVWGVGYRFNSDARP